MGIQQILIIALSLVMVGISVTVSISMFNTQNDTLTMRQIDNALMQVGISLNSLCASPVDLGRYAGNVKSRKNASDDIRKFLPEKT